MNSSASDLFFDLRDAFAALQDVQARIDSARQRLESLPVGSTDWLIADREHNELQVEWAEANQDFKQAYRDFGAGLDDLAAPAPVCDGTGI
jgi:hypothetical protein